MADEFYQKIVCKLAPNPSSFERYHSVLGAANSSLSLFFLFEQTQPESLPIVSQPFEPFFSTQLSITQRRQKQLLKSEEESTPEDFLVNYKLLNI